MRALAPLLTASFALGLLLGDRWPDAARFALGVALGACALAWLLRRLPQAAIAGACVAALTAGAGLIGSRVSRSTADLRAPAREAVIEGQVAQVERLPSRTRLALRNVSWISPDAPGPARIDVWIESSATPPVGATIRAAVRTREFAAGSANPGGADAARNLARRGVGGSARAVAPLLLQIVEQQRGNPLSWLENRRLSASNRLRELGRGGALLSALSLGDPGGLPEPDRRAWAGLGIAHLLSVSGLHLALAAAAAYGLATLAVRRAPALTARHDTRRLALLAALVTAALYAVLAGLATPTLRSLAMLAALAAAFALRRPASSAHALVGAALIVLALDPAALFAPGAQLSFAATAALVLGRASAAEHAGGRVWCALAGMLSTSARATLATAPIAALHFGAAPPLAGAANLLAIPLTAVVAMPLAFAAAGCALLAPQATPDAFFTSSVWLAERGLDGALALSSWAPRVTPHAPGASALAFSAVLCVLGLRTRSLALRAACALAAQLALALSAPPALEPRAPRIAFIDVGHGDAALVQTSDFALLVDAGAASPDGWDAGARVVVPALAALGVRRLDVLAISHADLDHRGGAHAVLRAFPCGELWLPHGALRDVAFAALVTEAREARVRVRERGLGDPALVRSGLRVTPLWPSADGADGLSEEPHCSLALRVELGGMRVLFLGDLEAGGEAALVASRADLRADVLKLAHHGSRSSTTPALLAAVAPRLAIASAPLRGRFRWPHAEVRERLAAAGIPLAWTGRDGALVVGPEGGGCVRRWRGPPRCVPVDRTRDPASEPATPRARARR